MDVPPPIVAPPLIAAPAPSVANGSDVDIQTSLQAMSLHDSVTQDSNAQATVIYPASNNLEPHLDRRMSDAFMLYTLRMCNLVMWNKPQTPIRYPEPFESGGALPHTIGEVYSLNGQDLDAAFMALQGAPGLLPLARTASEAQRKAYFLQYLGLVAFRS